MRPSTIAAIVVSAAAALVAPAAATAQISEAVTVSVGPTANPVVLGESFELSIDITNDDTEPTPPLVIHIDITDPASESSVDPEDWTSTLSKTLGVLGPGETRALSWQLQPISPGNFSIYAVALSAGVDTAAVSNIANVDVADRRSLNPGGILPVTIAAPTIIGGLLALQVRRQRRIRP